MAKESQGALGNNGRIDEKRHTFQSSPSSLLALKPYTAINLLIEIHSGYYSFYCRNAMLILLITWILSPVLCKKKSWDIMKHGNYVDVAHQQSRAKRITTQRATCRVIHGLHGISGKIISDGPVFVRVSRLKRGILTASGVRDGFRDTQIYVIENTKTI
jgi:hypothetical protein